MGVEVEVVADGSEKNAKGNDSVVKGNEKNANGHENVLIKGNESLVKSGVVAGLMREPLTPEKSIGEIIRCANLGCKSKPMALGMFCFSHILSDPRQQLYRPCNFVTRRLAHVGLLYFSVLYYTVSVMFSIISTMAI